MLVFVCFLLIAAGDQPVSLGSVEFNRDIRPILSENCYTCHGPDSNRRQAGLRLDQKEGLYRRLESGATPVVPGEASQSELLRRLSSDDPDVRMPPADGGKELSGRQIALIRKWIEQDAAWQPHWSLIPPRRPAIPNVVQRDWPVNAIDQFILARLEKELLKPAPDADRRTLARRLGFDLLGLPSHSAATNEFVSDDRLAAYDRLVDRLLHSPHFGERLAIWWLDLVRYADTVGYHGDQERQIAPYRDYVIDAFNRNLTFRQFTIEQLAGDLLADPTLWQRVAAGYNMLGMTTIEGGAQPKEYLAKYAADRVRNVSSVWLGATAGCAECHDHKFDPFTTKDFYGLAAFFGDIKQEGVANPPSDLPILNDDQSRRLARFDRAIEQVKRSGKSVDETRKELDALAKQRSALLAGARATIQTIAMTPRETRILPRGNWMDETGAVVTPSLPAFIKPLESGSRRADRLDLAEWIVARDNPLTARVVVNRLWKLFFGTGLSKQLDDLGSQGEWPTHPELLDWLAVEFMESGWDIKHMVRLMVESRTYQQSSFASKELRQRDPFNRLLARQARFRVDAEMIRDSALSASGLLVVMVGGDSVRPYQPADYYRHLNFPKRDYHPDSGDKQFRRGVYTHWQRTFLHPLLLAFDAPSREECTAERPISNTPAGALALLNDPSFVEAARNLAARVMREASDTASRFELAFELTLGRPPESRELERLTALYQNHREHYDRDRSAAEQLVRTGISPAESRADVAELAAWTSVARVLLNLDEAITRY